MLHPQCFTREWLQVQGEALNCTALVLVEKCIVALQLLGHLAESGLPLQFKGGTSLLCGSRRRGGCPSTWTS